MTKPTERPDDAEETPKGYPRKREGETYTRYWRRLTPEQELAISRAARWIGVSPRSIFDSYTRYEGDKAHGGGFEPEKPPSSDT